MAVGGGFNLCDRAGGKSGGVDAPLAVDFDRQLLQLRRFGLIGGRDLAADRDRDRRCAGAGQDVRGKLASDGDLQIAFLGHFGEGEGGEDRDRDETNANRGSEPCCFWN